MYGNNLLDKYIGYLDSKVRSAENPLGFSPGTIETKWAILRQTRMWDDVHIDLITPLFVNEHLDKLEREGHSRSHSNKVLKEVKCMFSFALQMGAIKSNPFAGMKERRMPKKRKEALTHDEANKLVAEAKRRGHPYYYIWLITLALGLRRSELAGLKWTDVDFDQHLVYLQRQFIPGEGLVPFLKDREERVVAIPAHIIPVLIEMKLKAKTEFVIEVECDSWKKGYQAGVLREFCREIGIKEVTHHQLRATHITLALVDGIPLGVVKENVGHAKLSTTDLYFRSAGINMRGQTDGLKLVVPQDNEADVIPIAERKS